MAAQIEMPAGASLIAVVPGGLSGDTAREASALAIALEKAYGLHAPTIAKVLALGATVFADEHDSVNLDRMRAFAKGWLARLEEGG